MFQFHTNQILINFVARIRSLKNPLYSFQTLEMATQPTSSKRPTCPTCSKPTSICLCTRFKHPILQNSVAVTILQHSLEKKHPLNSARIAKLGFKNVAIVSVLDVNFGTWFDVWVLDPNAQLGLDSFPENGNCRGSDCGNGSKLESGVEKISDIERCWESPEEQNNGVIDKSEECSVKIDFESKGLDLFDRVGAANNSFHEGCTQYSSFPKEVHSLFRTHGHQNEKTAHFPIRIDEPAMTISIGKYGSISSFKLGYMPLIAEQQSNFDQFLVSSVAIDALRKGFVVKKLQKKELNSAIAHQECVEEFEITVPKGSVLVFPSEKSVGVEEINFEVKNLIVLDGTWSKAKRMYNENPWLKFLPHLKLDLSKLSLYGEVRHQPKAGCLSTIESIVYTMNALGDYSEGLDDLLDVFKSMVGDQRRCKDERLSKISLD